MDNENTLLVSNTANSFSIYLPPLAVAKLGGMGAPVRATITRRGDDYTVAVVNDPTSKYSITHYTGNGRTGRIVTNERPVSDGSELPVFGTVHVDASYHEGIARMWFKLERARLRMDPKPRAPRTTTGNAPQQRKATPPVNPYERLNLLLSELNALLASGKVADVQLTAMCTPLDERCAVTGPIQGKREETFG